MKRHRSAAEGYGDLPRLLRELRERTKELQCIYGISRIRDTPRATIEYIFRGIVDIIPSSWQYPDIACARIVAGEREYRTANYRPGPDAQASDIRVHGKKEGFLEVVYIEKKPPSDEGPFLASERKLLDVIAERMGRIIEHRRAEDELQASNRRLRELLEHVQRVREEERRRIAGEIHDDFGQILTAFKMDISWLSKELPRDSEALLARVRSMSKLVDKALQDVKGLASELRAPLLDDFGLCAAVLHHAEEFQRRSGIRCDVRLEPKEMELDKDRSVLVFRICQELLTNILRHAQAARVRVRLVKKRGEVLLEVRDDGKGFSTRQGRDYRSFGLRSIMERVDFWKGKAGIRSAPGKGTTVSIRLPCSKERGSDPSPDSR
ncbi:MAG: sensor histidine kinase [Elusimicrobiota bacterium]